MAYQSEIEKLNRLWMDKPEQYFAPLAEAYRKAGEIDLAIDVLRGGLEKRPNYLSAHIVLGRCLFDQKNDVEAGKVFEQVLGLDSENIIALKALSEIAQRVPDFPRAQHWLKRLLEVDPMNEDAQQALVRVNAAMPAEAEVEPTAAVSETASDRVGGLELTSLAPEPESRPAWEPPVVEATAPPIDPDADTLSIPSFSETAAASQAKTEERPTMEPIGLERSGAATDGPVDTVEMEPIELERSAEPGPDIPADIAPPAGWELTEPTIADDGTLALQGSGRTGGDVDSETPTVEMEPLRPRPEENAGDIEVEPIHQESPLLESASGAWSSGAGDVELDRPIFETVPDGPANFELPTPPDEASLSWSEPQADIPEPSPELPAVPEYQPEHVSGAVPAEPALPELEPLPEPEERVAVRPAGRRPSEDLPLIMPEDVMGDSEPEPVITETMAEVYAKQGLLAEAREVYRKLLARRPGDAALAARLSDLERADAGRSANRPTRLSAAFTGGVSARAFLATILSARPGSDDPVDPMATNLGAKHNSASEGSPLERAFGTNDDDPLGAPTGPANDEMSLASVFGEDAGASRPAAAPPSAGGGLVATPRPPAESSSSFDQFFGVKKSGEASAKPAGPPAPSNPAIDSPDDDEFRAWLKGLKS